MKKLLFFMLALSLPLAQVAKADNDNDRKRAKRPAESAAQQRDQQSARPAAQAVRRPVRQSAQQANRGITRSSQAAAAAAARRQVNRTPRASVSAQRETNRAPRSSVSGRNQAVRSEAQLDGRNGRDRQRTAVSNDQRNPNRTVQRGGSNNRGSVRNGGNGNFDRNSFNVARSRVVRGNHNRNWWHSHYNTTFVLFGGGYYYWWNNYWYPAYGYSPYYNNYAYGEPIYGYNDLAPGQVLVNVQVELRNQGYYYGAIDGLIGPETRAALAAYQRDNGLLITSAVDEPTLVTLGLV